MGSQVHSVKYSQGRSAEQREEIIENLNRELIESEHAIPLAGPAGKGTPSMQQLVRPKPLHPYHHALPAVTTQSDARRLEAQDPGRRIWHGHLSGNQSLPPTAIRV